ncbi:MAG: PQQ-dependent sugar dehydrogenase [Pseudomonadota bacterium]
MKRGIRRSGDQNSNLILKFCAALQLTAYCAVIFLSVGSSAFAYTLPENFDNIEVISNLDDPDGMAFSPDGRLFISERITGRLRVATYNGGNDTWTLLTSPFHTFDIPKENGVPTARRSAGLRDIAFDPDFANNGFVYAFYMHNSDLQNRVVRIKQSASNANISDSSFGTNGEQTLINLPFNDTDASGSHNGGAIEFGRAADDSATEHLFITTGDGWTGEFEGDPVQDLTTYTGKIFRINADGTVPSDNPFSDPGSPYYDPGAGVISAIFALGLRNPYSMSRHPDTGRLYVNDARGTDKAQIHRIEAGDNYGHEAGTITIGNPAGVWANAATAGGELITGGAWMPEGGLGNYPAAYHGGYFAALWGGNSDSTGRINIVQSDSNTTVSAFETDVGEIGSNNIPVKPVVTRIGPEGDLYYLLTTYTTQSGAVRRVRYTSQETVQTPVLTPPGGLYTTAVNVTVTTSTPGATLYYTTDNSTPDTDDLAYTGNPIPVSEDTIVKVRGFKTDANTSATATEIYLIGARPDNQPPIVDAGPDQTVFVGTNVTLDGGGTTDPDGDDDFLTGELWTQTAGPNVNIIDATEEVAAFIPPEEGTYTFQLQVSDGIDIGTDTVTFSAVRAPRASVQPIAQYTFDEGSGSTVNDSSGIGDPITLTIQNTNNATWLSDGLSITGNNRISGPDAGNKLYSTCTNTNETPNELTIEVWIEPANISQSGPARIASFSRDLTNRNFTLGQEGDRYDTRLRTTTTDLNGVPSLTVPAATVNTNLSHVVYTRNSSGNAQIFLNRVLQSSGSVSGVFSNWNSGADYQITLANELTDDRTWLGNLYFVAFYCEALTSGDISQNYSAGLPPFSNLDDSDNDGVFDPFDNCPDDINADQTDTDQDTVGDACDADDDNDGVIDASDDDPLNPMICRDLDADQCDDCSLGVDGFGAQDDFDVMNDGLDSDTDGFCNIGDIDDDGDGVDDDVDNCPLVFNDTQDPKACENSLLCFALPNAQQNYTTVCL